MKKVKKISAANSKLIDFIESISFSISTVAAITMLTYGMFDFGADGTIDSLYMHPKAYALGIAAPLITGYLITKFDPDSPTAKDINNSFRVRKK